MATMEITTTVGCRLACTFCPQDKLMHAYQKGSEKMMSLSTFDEILAKIPKDVRINFSGLSEPWFNPNTTEMLVRALQDQRPVAIYTTLQGMTIEDSLRVVDLLKKHEKQVTVLCIHLPDKNMNMRGYRATAEFPIVLQNILDVVEEGAFPKRKFELMTMDGSGNVHEDVVGIVGNLNTWKGHTRAGNINVETATAIKAAATPRHDFSVYCAKTPFYDHNVVMPNGDVLLCCMDYSLKNVLGNILKQDYWDLFSSDLLQKIRITNQKPEFSKDSPCKSCNTAARAVPYYTP